MLIIGCLEHVYGYFLEVLAYSNIWASSKQFLLTASWLHIDHIFYFFLHSHILFKIEHFR